MMLDFLIAILVGLAFGWTWAIIVFVGLLVVGALLAAAK